MVLCWDSSFATGISELDEQHRQLFARVEALLQAIRRGSSREEVGRTLGFLEEYVRTHFAAEERLMRDAGYPGLAAHVAEHQRLVDDLAALQAEHRREGASPSLVLRVNARAQEWLERHVIGADGEMGRFLRRAS